VPTFSMWYGQTECPHTVANLLHKNRLSFGVTSHFLACMLQMLHPTLTECRFADSANHRTADKRNAWSREWAGKLNR
jgi:hypothetical protein